MLVCERLAVDVERVTADAVSDQRWLLAAGGDGCPVAAGTEDPLTPTVDTRPAAHIAPSVSRRRRVGVSQPKLWVCSQVRKPLAADAAAIAHPTHIAQR
jgi:hypothetical protein